MRAMRAWAAAVAGVLALGAGAGVAGATSYARSFEFDAPGVLPSAEPNVLYATDPNVGDPELEVASVADGRLLFDTIGGCCGFYVVFAEIDLSEGFTLETRMRVDAIEGAVYGGFSLFLLDRSVEYNLLFQSNGVAVNAVTADFPSGTLVELDHSVFRTYRFTAAPGADVAELWVDGELRASAPPAAEMTDESTAGWVFGDLAGFNSNARVEVDYLRVTVPEPAQGAVVAALLLAALGAARRGVRLA